MSLSPSRPPRALAVLILLLVVVAGCANQPIPEDGAPITLPERPGESAPPSETAPPETAPPETAPPETAPPETAPPEAAPPPEASDPDNAEQDGLSGEDWLLLIIIGAIVVALIVWVSSASSRRAQTRANAEADRSRRMRSIIGGCRWFHDQASLEALATPDPAMLAATWPATRQRVVSTEAEIAGLAAVDESLRPSLEQLGSAVTGLRNALDTYVSLRSTPDVQPSLVDSSAAAVSNARVQLQMTLSPLATTV